MFQRADLTRGTSVAQASPAKCVVSDGCGKHGTDHGQTEVASNFPHLDRRAGNVRATIIQLT